METALVALHGRKDSGDYALAHFSSYIATRFLKVLDQDINFISRIGAASPLFTLIVYYALSKIRIP